MDKKQDVIDGLDLGAVDYVTKPFDLDELIARIRAQLRRPAQHPPTRLEAGDIEVDLRTRHVRRAGTLVHLTAREFELLVYLMRHPNQVLTREQILSGVWGYDFDPGTNVLSVYVNYLRRKLTVQREACRRSRRSDRLASSWRCRMRRLLPSRPARQVGGGDPAGRRGRARRGASSPCIRATGAEIRSDLDDRLQADLGEFQARPPGARRTPAELERRGRDFIAGQGYHSDSRIFVIAPRGRPVATDQSNLVREERGEGVAEREREGDSGPEARGSTDLLFGPAGPGDGQPQQGWGTEGPD